MNINKMRQTVIKFVKSDMLREKSYASLNGDRVWVTRGDRRMLVELSKHSWIKNVGLVFYGLPLEIHTNEKISNFGEILIKGGELMKILQRKENSAVGKKLENAFREFASKL